MFEAAGCSVVNPDLHHFGNLDPRPDPHSHQIKIRIRINKPMASPNVWNLSLFWHFSKSPSLYLEARIRIRFRIRVMGRIWIRIRIKVMGIHKAGWMFFFEGQRQLESP
jgi:hypothetical protein